MRMVVEKGIKGEPKNKKEKKNNLQEKEEIGEGNLQEKKGVVH